MRRSRNFRQWGRGYEKISDNVFRHQLILQFYRGLRKTIFKVPEGIQHFPREGSKFFQGGGGWGDPNANFYRNL